MTSSPPRWQFWIDRGGTFTDIVARRPDGRLVAHKLLSENPQQYTDAAVAGIRHLLGVRPQDIVSAEQVASVRMGTTVATNALLERKGEPTLFLTTQGFGDALRIAWQNRPRLFDRRIVLPEMLYQLAIEVKERIDAHGKVLTPLDCQDLEKKLRIAQADGLRSIAIVFMHGYRYHQHEAQAADYARQLGFTHIYCSHRTSPLMKWVSRADTTVVDAYLSPILARYVDQVALALPGIPLLFMQSSGTLSDARSFHGKDAILSGPAGGIVGMARTAVQSGHQRVIGFDMGGTSTDVSHYAGQFEREFETQVAGVRIRAPMMSIHTVAAGGGSILQYDGARFRVGPESAGAKPGPASYGKGGPLTITDANIFLEKIQPDYFPRVFGNQGNQPLDALVIRDNFLRWAKESGRSAEAVAEGFIQIAVRQMANAIKKISVARGYDITRYTLQCFGGAGGQHACLVADQLGIDNILIHPLAGVLSAYGMGLADQAVLREQTLEQELLPHHPQQLEHLSLQLEKLADEAEAVLQEQVNTEGQITRKYRLHIRYQGSDTALVIPVQLPLRSWDTLHHDFCTAYQQRYAFLMVGKPLVAELMSVEVSLHNEEHIPTLTQAPFNVPQLPSRPTRFYSLGAWQSALLVSRQDLVMGHIVPGPAIITEENATTIVEPGWQASVDKQSCLLLQRLRTQTTSVSGTQNTAVSRDGKAQTGKPLVDPIYLEIFNNLFMNIAEQMGLQLQNTAHSVNIKERLDFSCALFDSDGQLIANAPHMPVHLGSMGESIRTVIDRHEKDMHPGDVFVQNDPYHGGTHLPDITVITPVFLAEHAKPSFYLGSRGHHADVGGMTPGSMPPFSKNIEEEGVVIDNLRLVHQGVLQEEMILKVLGGGVYPSRNPAQNLADLKAQIAANEKGQQELHNMVKEFGLAVVEEYMQHVQDHAEESVRSVITHLHDGQFTLPLDNGAQISVAIRVQKEARTAVIDFSGTSPQQTNNFNAPAAVCRAAVLYVFRTLVDDEIPLNAGCLKPLTIIIPEGSFLNPRSPSAVVAGNVETSSAITNALYGALGTMASAQSTMNNFTFGNQKYQYYETLSGGSGAGNGFNGTDVVQTHMTNSRLTDPEVLEFRFPVRLESHHIRQQSGGAGQWHGGNGAVRRIRFLETMTASILSNGRKIPPFGMNGGESGAPGINQVIRANGSIERLGALAEVSMQPGDIFEISTPGGGGYGKKLPA